MNREVYKLRSAVSHLREAVLFSVFVLKAARSLRPPVPTAPVSAHSIRRGLQLTVTAYGCCRSPAEPPQPAIIPHNDLSIIIYQHQTSNKPTRRRLGQSPLASGSDTFRALNLRTRNRLISLKPSRTPASRRPAPRLPSGSSTPS